MGFGGGSQCFMGGGLYNLGGVPIILGGGLTPHIDALGGGGAFVGSFGGEMLDFRGVSWLWDLGGGSSVLWGGSPLFGGVPVIWGGSHLPHQC